MSEIDIKHDLKVFEAAPRWQRALWYGVKVVVLVVLFPYMFITAVRNYMRKR